jgi:DNA-binding MarR family transcriptional regulator
MEVSVKKVNKIDLMTKVTAPGYHVNMFDRNEADAQRLRESIELFYFAYRAFTDQPDRLLERHGLGRVHHRILYFVGRKPGLAVGDLLKTLGISKQALNAPLRQLLSMKLVAAAAGTHDRRVRQLTLTVTGRKLEAQLTGRQMAHLASVFDDAGAVAERQWREVMTRLAARP